MPPSRSCVFTVLCAVAFTALNAAGETRIVADIEFVRIPAGTFTMGSPDAEPGRKPDESPQREVTFAKPFWMSAREITQAQWIASGELMKNPSETKDGDLPVTNVSWEDCKVFLNALNASAYGFFRLPTEAEWEYACRAGSQTAYDFGNDPATLDEHAWFAGNSNAAPQLVGRKTPNAWGLYDMHGNVYEWCLDRYADTYRGAPADGGPVLGGSSEPVYVRRGGSWSQPPENCRSAFRGSAKPGNARNDVGLRVVMIQPEIVPEAGVANKVITIKEKTPLRGAPSIEDTNVQSVHSPGTQLNIIEKRGDWLYVADAYLGGGWVAKQDLLFSPVAFAAVTHSWGDGFIDETKLPSIHGKFSSGLDVVLLAFGQKTSTKGKTKGFFSIFNGPSSNYMSLTRVDCAPTEKDYLIAVVGAKSVSVPALVDCSQPEREELDKRTRAVAFKEGFSEDKQNATTIAWARQGNISGLPFKFVLYATPMDELASPKMWKMLVCVLPNDNIFSEDVACADDPVIFEADKSVYVAVALNGCSNGQWGRSVYRLQRDKASLVYANYDWAN